MLYAAESPLFPSLHPAASLACEKGRAAGAGAQAGGVA